MAVQKISEMTNAVILLDEDYVPILQSGLNKIVQVKLLRDYNKLHNKPTLNKTIIENNKLLKDYNVVKIGQGIKINDKDMQTLELEVPTALELEQRSDINKAITVKTADKMAKETAHQTMSKEYQPNSQLLLSEGELQPVSYKAVKEYVDTLEAKVDENERDIEQKHLELTNLVNDNERDIEQKHMELSELVNVNEADIEAKHNELSQLVNKNKQDNEKKYNELNALVLTNENDIENKYSNLSKLVNENEQDIEAKLVKSNQTIENNKAELMNEIKRRLDFIQEIVVDCNTIIKTSIAKTDINTINLPDVLDNEGKRGILTTFFENESNKTGIQIYYPVDGVNKEKAYIRTSIKNSWATWRRFIMEDELQPYALKTELETKINKNQGVSYSGNFLGIDMDGIVKPMKISSESRGNISKNILIDGDFQVNTRGKDRYDSYTNPHGGESVYTLPMWYLPAPVGGGGSGLSYVKVEAENGVTLGTSDVYDTYNGEFNSPRIAQKINRSYSTEVTLMTEVLNIQGCDAYIYIVDTITGAGNIVANKKIKLQHGVNSATFTLPAGSYWVCVGIANNSTSADYSEMEVTLRYVDLFEGKTREHTREEYFIALLRCSQHIIRIITTLYANKTSSGSAFTTGIIFPVPMINSTPTIVIQKAVNIDNSDITPGSGNFSVNGLGINYLYFQNVKTNLIHIDIFVTGEPLF